MAATHDFDVIVIGGGSAGLTAAGMAAVLGAKTLLIHADTLGGDCTWHGCVPSKSLLRAAKAAHNMRHAGRFGLTAADPPHDFAQVMERVRHIREHIYQEADAPPNLEKLGVELLDGRAEFVDSHSVQASGASYRARRFILATGSRPRCLAVPGSELPHVLTNETLFDLRRRSQQLAVIGGGPIGIEMAQAFRRLGTEVTVLQQGAGILPHDDPELSAMLRERLQAEGVRFIFQAEVSCIEQQSVLLKDGRRVEADAVLTAIGRMPNVESLNLQAAGVRAGPRGIEVNPRGRTSVSHIYACGDVTGQHLFTHMAEHTAKVAVTNAVLRIPSAVDATHVPWCTFTDPELAHVGATEQQLKKKGTRYEQYRFPFAQLDRALTDSAPEGLVKVLSGRGGRILGVSILGAHAGELIAEYALAMKQGVRLANVSSTIHPYPTYALANRRAADHWVNSLLTPGRVRWLQRIFRLRGRSDGITHLQ